MSTVYASGLSGYTAVKNGDLGLTQQSNSTPYIRPDGAKDYDLHQARSFEAEVRAALGPHVVDQTTALDSPDFGVAGVGWVEVKEKRQSLTPRWHLLPGVSESELFVIDEIAVRRATRFGPAVWFLLRDVPGDRLFAVSLDEMVSVERARVNRGGKGKWIVDLRQFRQLGSLAELLPALQPYPLVPDCVGKLPVGQV